MGSFKRRQQAITARVVSIVESLESVGTDVCHGCEVGVWKGNTSRVLLKRFPHLFLWMVDSWKIEGVQWRTTQSNIQESLKEAIESTQFARDRCNIVEQLSMDAVMQFRDELFDFVFINADHTYKAVYEDLRGWWPKVRDGGILCGDNYNDRLERYRQKWGVKKAVDEWLAENRWYQIVLKETTYFAVIKI